jgi:hypothetical protein
MVEPLGPSASATSVAGSPWSGPPAARCFGAVAPDDPEEEPDWDDEGEDDEAEDDEEEEEEEEPEWYVVSLRGLTCLSAAP